MRQERMLLHEHITGVRHLGAHFIRRQPRTDRRTLRRIQTEVDDRHAAPGLELILQLSKV